MYTFYRSQGFGLAAKMMFYSVHPIKTRSTLGSPLLMQQTSTLCMSLCASSEQTEEGLCPCLVVHISYSISSVSGEVQIMIRAPQLFGHAGILEELSKVQKQYNEAGENACLCLILP